MLSANWGMQIAGMAFQTCSISDEKYFLNKTHSAIIYKNTAYILTEIPFSLRYLFKSIISNSLKWNKEAANAENKYVFNCMNTDKICIFTDNGKMHSIKVADIPLVRFRDKGTPADNLSNYDSAQERMLYVAPLASVKENTLLFVTAASMCKLVSGAEFDVAKRTIVSTKLAEEDSLIFVGSADEMEQVVFQSEGGYFLRFQKQDISAMKKTSIGVRGMKLAEGDKLDHAYLLESRQEYTITYHDKPYVLNRIKLSKRDSKGIKPRI